MEQHSFFKNQTRLAAIGIFGILPALALCTSGFIQIISGYEGFSNSLKIVDHPAIILGGLMLAFGLNVLAIFQIKLQPEDGSLIGKIQMRGKWFNVAVTAASIVLTAVILLYAFVENFEVVPR